MGNLIRRENREISRARTPETFWDPFRMVDALLRWDPLRSVDAFVPGVGGFTPSFDVKETKDAYLVSADLPGLKEGDVEVSVTGNVLTISGERTEERREEGEQYFAMERRYGRFARSLSLPDGADSDRVKADLKNGVLSLEIPKKPEVQAKKITIGKSSEGGKARA